MHENGFNRFQRKRAGNYCSTVVRGTACVADMAVYSCGMKLVAVNFVILYGLAGV